MTRRERLQRKLELRREWAEKRTAKAAALRAVGGSLRHDWAFVTQPGHIPERARMNRRDERAHEHGQVAAHHESKASGLEAQLDRAIFSDDPDAVARLRAKVSALTAKRDRMKEVNRLYRKGDAAGLEALGLNLEKLRENVSAIGLSWVKAPYESYQLTNLGAEIRRAEARIQEIEDRQKVTAEAEIAPGGVLIDRREDANWCRVTFAEKPDRSILDALRGAGYRWGGGSWQGYLDKLPAEVAALAD